MRSFPSQEPTRENFRTKKSSNMYIRGLITMVFLPFYLPM